MRDLIENARKLLNLEMRYDIFKISNEENDFYDVYVNKHGVIVNVIPNSLNKNPESINIAKTLLKNNKGKTFKERTIGNKFKS